jgi:hypothetical protein
MPKNTTTLVGYERVYSTIYNANTESEKWPLLIQNLKSGVIKGLYLHYSNNYSVGFNLVKVLKKSNCLEEVILKNTLFNQPLSEIIEALNSHKKLTSLSVRNYSHRENEVDDKFMKALANLINSSSLEKLSIEFLLINSTQFYLVCNAIAKSTSLKEVDLKEVIFSPENEAHLKKALTANKKVRLKASDEVILRILSDTSSQNTKPIVTQPFATWPVAVKDKPPRKAVRIKSVAEINFNQQLRLIDAKKKEFDIRKLSADQDGDVCKSEKLGLASLAAKNLLESLKTVANAYFEDTTQAKYRVFQETCKVHIKAARVELEQHRGLKQILGNLALAVIGAGVLYLIAGVIHKAITGNFLFFQTDSAEKINLVEASIDNAAPK